MKIRVGLAVISLFLLACETKSRVDDVPKKTNVVKEYINVPKDKANNAKKKMEAAQDALNKQAGTLENE